MKNYFRLGIIVLCLHFFTSCIYAQQTPLFADYYYNQVLINPAHSGYYQETEVTLSNFGFSDQVDGSPRTFAGLFSTNFLDNTIGLLSLIHI